MQEMRDPKSKHFGIQFYFERNNSRGKVAAKRLQKASNPENRATPNLATHPIK
jgi:hypothetical protein